MNQNNALPVGLAEQAKIHHLAGQSTRALLYLREAMNRTGREGSGALLARYYSQLSLEILEQEGHYADVIDYCQRAIDHYSAEPPRSDIARKDLAENWQRSGICQLRRGEHEAACQAFRQALAVASEAPLPLARKLLEWTQRRLQINEHQLERLLQQHRYYSIRKDTTEPERALKLPQLEAVAV